MPSVQPLKLLLQFFMAAGIETTSFPLPLFLSTPLHPLPLISHSPHPTRTKLKYALLLDDLSLPLFWKVEKGGLALPRCSDSAKLAYVLQGMDFNCVIPITLWFSLNFGCRWLICLINLTSHLISSNTRSISTGNLILSDVRSILIGNLIPITVRSSMSLFFLPISC